MYVRTYVRTYVYMYMYMYRYRYMYVCMYVYRYLYKLIYIYIYIHTYIHTYISMGLLARLRCFRGVLVDPDLPPGGRALRGRARRQNGPVYINVRIYKYK